jgi:hypothetical protein
VWLISPELFPVDASARRRRKFLAGLSKRVAIRLKLEFVEVALHQAALAVDPPVHRSLVKSVPGGRNVGFGSAR